MSYSTKTDIQKEISDDELIGLTDDEGAGIINEARVTAAIVKGDAIADPFYAKVTEVPIPAPVPEIVKQNSITMGIYFLYSRRSAIPEIRRKNFEDVMALLMKISKGEIAISPTIAADYDDQVKTSHTEDDKTFSKGKVSDDSSGSLDNY